MDVVRREPPGLLSVVVPLYDEEASIEELYQRLCAELAALPCPAELVFVDDGSSDRTYPILAGLVRSDERVQVIRLSRNFGHQRALTAGLDAARGDAVVTMDGDLQHPPELIGRLVDTLAGRVRGRPRDPRGAGRRRLGQAQGLGPVLPLPRPHLGHRRPP